MRRQAKQGKALGLDYTQNTREGKDSRGVAYFLARPMTGRHGWVLQSTHQSTPLHQHNTHRRIRQCSYNLLPDTPLQFLETLCSVFQFFFPSYVAQEPSVPWTQAGPAGADPLPVTLPTIEAKHLSGPKKALELVEKQSTCCRTLPFLGALPSTTLQTPSSATTKPSLADTNQSKHKLNRLVLKL